MKIKVYADRPLPYQVLTGTGVFPLPFRYGDDGRVPLVVVITDAAGDDLTVLDICGVTALSAPVTTTVGDEEQTAADIAAEINGNAIGFTAVAYLNMVAVLSTNTIVAANIPLNTGVSGDYTVTFDGATVFTACQTPYILEKAGTVGNHYLYSGANPGIDIVPISQGRAIGLGTSLWIPALGTWHRISQMIPDRVASQSKSVRATVFLDPVPSTSMGDVLCAVPFPTFTTPMVFENIGGSNGTVDGQIVVGGQKVAFTNKDTPVLYAGDFAVRTTAFH